MKKLEQKKKKKKVLEIFITAVVKDYKPAFDPGCAKNRYLNQLKGLKHLCKKSLWLHRFSNKNVCNERLFNCLIAILKCF